MVHRSVLALLLTLSLASLSSHAATVPQSIVVLDSLSGEATLVHGKVVYVDFWASWCVPCRQSFPWMNDLLARYADKGLQVIGINVDRDRDAAAKFLKEHPASFPVIYDPDGKLAKLYNLQVMPTSFIYGRDGTLQHSEQGFDRKETESVESLIRKLLEEKTTK